MPAPSAALTASVGPALGDKLQAPLKVQDARQRRSRVPMAFFLVT